jgi:hypothetical protein
MSPPFFQSTLVAHYGRKPSQLTTLVRRLQQRLDEALGRAFQPYAIDQVHGTIIGLEGCRVEGGVRNENSGALMDIAGFVDFLSGPGFVPIHIRAGGYREATAYPFRSRNTHPYQRSFSIQAGIAVAMGWPAAGAPDALDLFRRAAEQFGIRHKWHRTDDEVDNDFFLVIGLVERGDPVRSDAAVVEAAAEQIRSELAASGDTSIEIDRDALSLVAYSDPRLPLSTSRRYALDEPDLAAKLTALYPDCHR